MDRETIIVNLYSGPGTGKSTTTAGVYFFLKLLAENVEMVREYAKDKAWEGTHVILDDQLYVFGKQHHKIFSLLGKVDVIINDSPLLNSIVYNKTFGNKLNDLVIDRHNELSNMDFFLLRVKPYNPSGRMQTEEEAKAIDKTTLDFMDRYELEYDMIPADMCGTLDIVILVLKKLDKEDKIPELVAMLKHAYESFAFLEYDE